MCLGNVMMMTNLASTTVFKLELGERGLHKLHRKAGFLGFSIDYLID